MFPRHKEIRILMLLAGPAMLINVNRRYDRTDRGPSFDRLKIPLQMLLWKISKICT